MKKLCIILAAAYLVLLGVGMAVLLPRGLTLWGDFWLQGADGSLTCRGAALRYAPAGEGWDYTLSSSALGEITLQARPTDGGGTRFTASDGWALEPGGPGEAAVTIETEGRLSSLGDHALIPLDFGAMGLVFEPAGEPERVPFYDDAGREAGHTLTLTSESGHVIYFGEHFTGQSGDSAALPRPLLLTEGEPVALDPLAHSLYVNGQGEYLVNPDRLAYVSLFSGRYLDRGVLCSTLGSLPHREVRSRGHWGLLLLYTALYALGAASILWPEKLAFLGSRWRYRQDPELSWAGESAMRVGGVLLALLGASLLFLPLFP